MTKYDDYGDPIPRFSRKGKFIIAIAASLLLIGGAGAIAFIAITGSSTGNVTATAANLAITGSVTSSSGGTCTNTATTFSCSGFSVGESGVETETFQVHNSGQSSATVNLATSAITPAGATCTISGPASIAGGASGNYTLTYTAGSTPGSASCNSSLS